MATQDRSPSWLTLLPEGWLQADPEGREQRGHGWPYCGATRCSQPPAALYSPGCSGIQGCLPLRLYCPGLRVLQGAGEARQGCGRKGGWRGARKCPCSLKPPLMSVLHGHQMALQIWDKGKLLVLERETNSPRQPLIWGAKSCKSSARVPEEDG